MEELRLGFKLLKKQIPEHVDPPFRFMLTHHSGDVDPFFNFPFYQRYLFVSGMSHSIAGAYIHNLSGEDILQIFSEPFPGSLSETDKSVLYIANKLNACVLSSDKSVRNCAKNKDIKYHGMIWIFDKLVETGNLKPGEAAEKFTDLIQTNFIYQNNKHLMAEIEKRLKVWK